MVFYPFLQAASGATPPPWMQFAPLIFIFVIVYFFMIRPQSKKQKESEKMISAITKGDKVVTIGGVHGVVMSTEEKTLVLRVDDNTKIKFNRTAIATVLVDKPAAVPDKAGKKGAAVEDKSPRPGKKTIAPADKPAAVPDNAPESPVVVPAESGDATPASEVTGADTK